MAAVGLRLSDLFADQKATRPRGAVISEYVETDENGHALFRVCRTESKNFFQQRFEAGKFVSGMIGARRVVFNLREVLKAKNVIVCEGEKDVETLRAVGLTA